MNRYTVAFLLLLSFLTTSAQPYTPFPTENAYWRYKTVVLDNMSNTYTIIDFLLILDGSDTVINGLSYKKLLRRSASMSGNSLHGIPSSELSDMMMIAQQPDEFYAAIREINKQIFIRIGTLTEGLLYDFNTAVGDSMPCGYADMLPGFVKRKLLDIEPILIGGISRIKYKTDGMTVHTTLSGSQPLYVIDGIGSNSGLIDFNGTFFVGFSDSKVNYSSGNMPIVYMWPHGTPTSVPTAPKDEDVNVYPNPFNEIINIGFANGKRAIVYNATGSVIIDRTIEGHTQLATSDLPTGFYFLKLFDNDGAVIATKKLVKE